MLSIDYIFGYLKTRYGNAKHIDVIFGTIIKGNASIPTRFLSYISWHRSLSGDKTANYGALKEIMDR